MLQKRHLPDQPVEYLVKGRSSAVKRTCERWVPADQLLATELGAQLIEMFEQSKVGLLAVDAYLPKRRSLGTTRSDAHAAFAGIVQDSFRGSDREQHCCSEQKHVVTPSSPLVDSQHCINNSAVKKCSSPSRASVMEFSQNRTAVSESEIGRSVHRTFQLKMRSKLCRTLRSQIFSVKNNSVISSQIIDNAAQTNEDSSVISDSESDDDVRYSLANNDDSHSQVTESDEGVRYCLAEDVSSKKTDCKTEIENTSAKRPRKSGPVLKKRRKPDDVQQKSSCFDPEIQFKVYCSPVLPQQDSSKSGKFCSVFGVSTCECEESLLC